MAKNLGGAIIGLLESDRVDLRTAAATVLAAVGKGDRSLEAALVGRLADADGGVRRIALEGLAGMGASGFAAQLVPLLGGGDEPLAERAAQILAQQGAAAEAALREAIGAGPLAARRVIAQLLLRRGTQPAVEAVLDQLSDDELGPAVLELVRHAIEQGNEKLGKLIDKLAAARATGAGKALAKAWARALKAPAGGAPAKAKQGKKPAAKAKQGKKQGGKQPAGAAAEAPGAPGVAGGVAAPATVDPLRDPAVTRELGELGGLLRLIGSLARPQAQPLLLEHTAADQPRPIRLAAIAGLRRIAARGEAPDAEPASAPQIGAWIAALIELADDEDAAIAQAAVDALHGAQIPESLARPFGALAQSRHAFAQRLATERAQAGAGGAALKALVEALGGDDPTARDAAARGLARAPESVLPLTRALVATEDEPLARRYAAALRAHRGHIPSLAGDELVAALRAAMERTAKGTSTAEQSALERILVELVADLAPARHVELLFERARRLHEAGKPAEAFGILRPLLRARADLDAAIDDEQRFLLARLALETAGAGILRTARDDDPMLEQLARLATKGFPVARRLSREQEVSDETIYALGFRLLESGDGAGEDLGAELLQGIIDERPRSKLAKAARNKLKLTGHLDED